MPPARRSYGCKRCCFVWFPVRTGLLVIGCAHCSKVASKVPVPVGDQDLLDRQVAGSHAGHKKLCGRPIR